MRRAIAFSLLVFLNGCVGSTAKPANNGNDGYDPGQSAGGATSAGGGTTGSAGGSGNGGSGNGGGGDSAPVDAGVNAGTPDGGDPLDSVADPLSTLVGFKTGAAQLQLLCARGNGDAVSKAFCASPTPPVITSLIDLQKLLGLDFKAGNILNGLGGNPAFVMTGHSTSLVTKFTSAINPRAIIFTPPITRGRVTTPQPLPSFIAMGFVRGEQFVELVSNDPTANGGKGDLRFFLFRFAQACNATLAGCTVDDLLTPKIESNFIGYSLYQDTDVANTVFDCLQCHQTTGPGTAKILRQQELQNPWGHFFRNNRPNGLDMLNDYQAAHGMTETYAGIPGAVIFNPNDKNNNGAGPFNGGGPDPAALEGLVENQGFKAQPNEFISDKVLDQGRSAVWLALYDNTVAGKDIPPPYHETRVTDPTKLATATTAYLTASAGTAPLTMDIRDVFLDAALQDLTFRPSTDLVSAGNGTGIMVQICQQCHNPSLDQTITRARFDVTKLATMSVEEKQKAIQRLTLDPDAFRRMPPTRFRTLSAAEIQLVTTALSQ